MGPPPPQGTRTRAAAAAASTRAFRPAPDQTPSPSASCAPFALLLILVASSIAGFVIYVFIDSNQKNAMRDDIKALEARLSALSSSNNAPLPVPAKRLDAIVPPQPAPSRLAIEQFLRFETPMNDDALRLARPGLLAAQRNGYKLECSFGRSVMQPTPDQVSIGFRQDPGTSEEYILVRAQGAFQGRYCAMSWK